MTRSIIDEIEDELMQEQSEEYDDSDEEDEDEEDQWRAYFEEGYEKTVKEE